MQKHDFLQTEGKSYIFITLFKRHYLFQSNLTQLASSEEGVPVEKMSPKDWAVGKVDGHFLN